MSVRASAFFGTPTPCVAATPRSPRSPSRSGSPTSRATSTLDQDGTLVARDRGTPQGSAVSPVLANLYLHYTFDVWLAREHPAGAVRPRPRPDLDHVFHAAPRRRGRRGDPDRGSRVGVDIDRHAARALTARALERPHLRRPDGSFTN